MISERMVTVVAAPRTCSCYNYSAQVEFPKSSFVAVADYSYCSYFWRNEFTIAATESGPCWIILVTILLPMVQSEATVVLELKMQCVLKNGIIWISTVCWDSVVSFAGIQSEEMIPRLSFDFTKDMSWRPINISLCNFQLWRASSFDLLFILFIFLQLPFQQKRAYLDKCAHAVKLTILFSQSAPEEQGSRHWEKASLFLESPSLPSATTCSCSITMLEVCSRALRNLHVMHLRMFGQTASLNASFTVPLWRGPTRSAAIESRAASSEGLFTNTHTPDMRGLEVSNRATLKTLTSLNNEGRPPCFFFCPPSHSKTKRQTHLTNLPNTRISEQNRQRWGGQPPYLKVALSQKIPAAPKNNNGINAIRKFVGPAIRVVGCECAAFWLQYWGLRTSLGRVSFAGGFLPPVLVHLSSPLLVL